LKLLNEAPVSNFAFSFNLRHYTSVLQAVTYFSQRSAPYAVPDEVGRCRLPVSQPVLKARLVSALETKM
jgi:hypothetical protein